MSVSLPAALTVLRLLLKTIVTFCAAVTVWRRGACVLPGIVAREFRQGVGGCRGISGADVCAGSRAGIRMCGWVARLCLGRRAVRGGYRERVVLRLAPTT